MPKQLEFSASTGWMTSFLKRHALHNIKIKGETASADELAAKEFPQKLRKIIEDAGQTPRPSMECTIVESGLFWKKKCLAELMLGNHRKLPVVLIVAKGRVTLLFCSNASGERMLKPLLVNSQVNSNNNF